MSAVTGQMAPDISGFASGVHGLQGQVGSEGEMVDSELQGLLARLQKYAVEEHASTVHGAAGVAEKFRGVVEQLHTLHAPISTFKDLERAIDDFIHAIKGTKIDFNFTDVRDEQEDVESQLRNLSLGEPHGSRLGGARVGKSAAEEALDLQRRALLVAQSEENRANSSVTETSGEFSKDIGDELTDEGSKRRGIAGDAGSAAAGSAAVSSELRSEVTGGVSGSLHAEQSSGTIAATLEHNLNRLGSNVQQLMSEAVTAAAAAAASFNATRTQAHEGSNGTLPYLLSGSPPSYAGSNGTATGDSFLEAPRGASNGAQMDCDDAAAEAEEAEQDRELRLLRAKPTPPA